MNGCLRVRLRRHKNESCRKALILAGGITWEQGTRFHGEFSLVWNPEIVSWLVKSYDTDPIDQPLPLRAEIFWDTKLVAKGRAGLTKMGHCVKGGGDDSIMEFSIVGVREDA